MRSLSLGYADDEGAEGGLDDVVGDHVEVVDFGYSVDLGEESVERSEVAAGDSGDRGDCLVVGEVVGVEFVSEVPRLLERAMLGFPRSFTTGADVTVRSECSHPSNLRSHPIPTPTPVNSQKTTPPNRLGISVMRLGRGLAFPC